MTPDGAGKCSLNRIWQTVRRYNEHKRIMTPDGAGNGPGNAEGVPSRGRLPQKAVPPQALIHINKEAYIWMKD